MPDEYDYFEQMDDAIKAANEFHASPKINEECPPPYYPIDMGKLYGLVKEVARLREIEAAARTLVVEAGLNDALHTEKSHVPVSVERVRKLTSALLDKE
jgi:hypothetical protein